MNNAGAPRRKAIKKRLSPARWYLASSGGKSCPLAELAGVAVTATCPELLLGLVSVTLVTVVALRVTILAGLAVRLQVKRGAFGVTESVTELSLDNP